MEDPVEKLDPSTHLPLELFAMVFTWLEPQTLLTTALVSSNWALAANDNLVWNRLCERMWHDKVYVPKKLVEMRINNAKSAYFEAIADAKRQHITDEELFSFDWEFRFKASAGEDWIQDDAWWNGKQPTKMRYLPSGKVEVIPSRDLKNAHFGATERMWKWIETAAGRTGPKGSFLQVNAYPPYIFSRTSNWGFIMESCWVLLCSFPLPPRGQCQELEDENLHITTSVMHQEALAYNTGMHIPFLNNANPHQVIAFLNLLAQHGGLLIDSDDEDNEEGEEGEEEEDEDEEGEAMEQSGQDQDMD